MQEKPYIVFPYCDLADKRTSLSSKRPGILNIPNLERQEQRLLPKFQALKNVIHNQNISVQASAIGLEPECTIVMEIIGGVNDFLSITRNIDGLEWLGEFAGSELEPDEDFYYLTEETNERKDSRLNSKLFVTMANQRAIDELLSLWSIYKQNPKAPFDRGKSKLKEIFKHLFDIRRWSIKDRLEDTYILENWKFRKQIGNDILPVEVELWYRDNPDIRRKTEQLITEYIEDLGGEIKNTSCIEEIRYHGILAYLPINFVNNVSDLQDINLVKCDNVMFLKPTAQTIVGYDSEEEPIEVPRRFSIFSNENEPIVAVLDGSPATNHPAIRDALIIDDPDDFTTYYQVNQMKHGTAICSLILRGDLLKENKLLRNPLYVRPILVPSDTSNNLECIPDDTLAIDLVFRAVKRMFDGEADELPVAPNVKIINLSIGDLSRPFNRIISPWARLIDYLSWKYKVLFCISSGNYVQDILLDSKWLDFKNLADSEKEKSVLKAMISEDRNRKILSPAESINALTVGSSHFDLHTEYDLRQRVNLLSMNHNPSPITRFGPGIKNCVKPEILVAGGVQLYNEPLTDNQKKFQINPIYTQPPGICVAAPNNKSYFYRGTSFSNALTTRAASIIYNHLEDLGLDLDFHNEQIAPLLKALLVHSSSWNSYNDKIEKILKEINHTYHWSDLHRITSKILGYGFADFENIFNCTNQRVIVIGLSSIKDEEGHIFSFPLPSSLAGLNIKFRLKITLSWLTPINSKHNEYRRARLWFDSKNDSNLSYTLGGQKIDLDRDRNKRGTIQHEIFEGEEAVAFADGDNIKIKINCKAEAGGRLKEGIPYSIVVSLEIPESVKINIYDEIKSTIGVQQETQVKTIVNVS